MNHDNKSKNSGILLMKAYTIHIYDNKLLLNLEPPNRNEKLKTLEGESLMNHKRRTEGNKELMKSRNKKS